MFCNNEDSPVGAVAVNPPAVVLINKISPALKLDVFNPDKVPNVITTTLAFKFASALANPKLGILEVTSASALETIGVLPDIPDM